MLALYFRNTVMVFSSPASFMDFHAWFRILSYVSVMCGEEMQHNCR